MNQISLCGCVAYWLRDNLHEILPDYKAEVYDYSGCVYISLRYNGEERFKIIFIRGRGHRKTINAIRIWPTHGTTHGTLLITEIKTNDNTIIIDTFEDNGIAHTYANQYCKYAGDPDMLDWVGRIVKYSILSYDKRDGAYALDPLRTS